MTPDQLKKIRSGEVPTHRPRRTVPILLDGELREQIEAIQTELVLLESRQQAAEQAAAEGRPVRRINSVDAERIRTLREDLAELIAKAEEKTMYVVVEGLNGTDWLHLVKEHPPVPNHEGKIVHIYNVDTIKAPLAKACIIGHREKNEVDSPILPLDEDTVDWLLSFISAHQLDMLADAAYQCCQRDDAVPLDRARALLSRTTASASA